MYIATLLFKLVLFHFRHSKSAYDDLSTLYFRIW